MRFSTMLSLATAFACEGIVLIFTLLAIFLLGYFLIYRLLMKGKKKLSPLHLAWWCVFLCYCFVVLAATLFSRCENAMTSKVYPLFYSYLEAWITSSAASWRNIIFNYLMFVPFGFLLSLRFAKLRRPLPILLWGFGFSFLIETLQLVTHRGMFEFDDLLGNALGALIGYGLFSMLKKLITGSHGAPERFTLKVLISPVKTLD